MTSTPCPSASIDDEPCTNGAHDHLFLDATNAGAYGCEDHITKLLVRFPRSRVVGSPHDPGSGIRIFKAASAARRTT
ncbi:hypothetical protein [Streptomyces showdoensis]|uniref:hypothetical protein n=1 Tax=Streptomyces showdoensis TaxID=68268 RepID=UPI0013F4C74F|nr:hypothetical protein [Streptomyces showdoensis]